MDSIGEMELTNPGNVLSVYCDVPSRLAFQINIAVAFGKLSRMTIFAGRPVDGESKVHGLAYSTSIAKVLDRLEI